MHFFFLCLLALQDGPPQGQLTLEGGARVTRVATVRAQIRSLPPGTAGLQMALSTDPKAQPAWMPFAESAIVELPAGDGDKKVTLRLKDAKGRESAPVEAAIRLDTTPPLVSVKAPERVGGASVRAVFEAPDAVALQYTEDLSNWSSWEPFSTPRSLPLSKGAGKKLLFVRFRDEAGNESLPARLIIEAQAASPAADAAALRDVKVGVQKEPSGTLRLRVWIDGVGLTETRLMLDGVELQARGPWKPEAAFDLSPADGPRRVTVDAWDASGAVPGGEAVFQDRDASLATLGAAAEATTRPGWNVGLKAGVLTSGIKLDTSTPSGLRTIKQGPMAAVRLEGGYQFDGTPFVMGSLELDEGQDVSALALGFDVGLDLNLGRAFDTDFCGIVSVGGFFSWLEANDTDFGHFNPGFGARAAVGVQGRLSDRLWADLTVDFRYALWKFDEQILRGDSHARMMGPGILAGVSWRF